MTTEELFNYAREQKAKGNYQAAFYCVNDALLEDPKNKTLQKLHKDISKFYYQELLGLKAEDYKDLTSLLTNTKRSIAKGEPESANGYLNFIEKHFKTVHINMKFYPEKEEILFYNGGALTEREDFTFFYCHCTKETFLKLGTEEQDTIIIDL